MFGFYLRAEAGQNATWPRTVLNPGPCFIGLFCIKAARIIYFGVPRPREPTARLEELYSDFRCLSHVLHYPTFNFWGHNIKVNILLLFPCPLKLIVSRLLLCVSSLSYLIREVTPHWREIYIHVVWNSFWMYISVLKHGKPSYSLG